MAEIRHLSNAPITEAIVDIRARLPSNFRPEGFSHLPPALAKAYPTREEQRVFRSQFRVHAGQVARGEDDQEFRGYLYKSLDGKQIAQFRTDGFTFSRLEPYTTWDDVSRHARALWEAFREAACPEAISRIAVRYINHLRLPDPAQLEEHFTTPPTTIPADWPQVIVNLLNRITVFDERTRILANVTQAVEPALDPNQLQYLFDIDCFRELDLDPDNDQALWRGLEELRVMKNRIFFSSITESTARIYE